MAALDKDAMAGMEAVAGMDVESVVGENSGSSAAVAVTSNSVFRVYMNPSVVASHEPGNVEVLQCELADWFPGPVLFERGTQVRLVAQKDWGYRGLVGTVREHLASDPRVVTVDLPASDDTEAEIVQVVHSILRLGTDAKETKAREDEKSVEMRRLVEQLLSESPAAGAGAGYTLVGYNEFQCGGKAEQEYWVCLNPSMPFRITAGQIPMHCSEDESGRHTFCVMHLQYSGSDPAASTVQRAAVRVTKTIELRAHQDKCRPCEVCRKPGSYRDTHTAHCICTEFKWQDTYGEQYREQQCGAVESLCARQDMAHACTMELPLNDARQRRFALVVGNSEYRGYPGSIFKRLPGAVGDASCPSTGAIGICGALARESNQGRIRARSDGMDTSAARKCARPCLLERSRYGAARRTVLCACRLWDT